MHIAAPTTLPPLHAARCSSMKVSISRLTSAGRFRSRSEISASFSSSNGPPVRP